MVAFFHGLLVLMALPFLLLLAWILANDFVGGAASLPSWVWWHLMLNFLAMMALFTVNSRVAWHRWFLFPSSLTLLVGCLHHVWPSVVWEWDHGRGGISWALTLLFAVFWFCATWMVSRRFLVNGQFHFSQKTSEG